MILVAALVLSTAPAAAQEGEAPSVTTDVPQQQQQTGYECRQINKGGPIAGIVVASVFWWLLPMSIPVWVTQAKKLKRRKAEIYEQQQRGCP
jgi:hypothetical protein